MDTKIKTFLSVVGLLIVGVVIVASVRGGSSGVTTEPSQYDGFATCLAEKGAVFYGAFWCPHCQTQKKAFGSSAKLLPYVECSTVDARGQTQACIDKNITGYPTWEFADGVRLSGEQSFDTLAEKTGCVLPDESR